MTLASKPRVRSNNTRQGPMHEPRWASRLTLKVQNIFGKFVIHIGHPLNLKKITNWTSFLRQSRNLPTITIFGQPHGCRHHFCRFPFSLCDILWHLLSIPILVCLIFVWTIPLSYSIPKNCHHSWMILNSYFCRKYYFFKLFFVFQWMLLLLSFCVEENWP